MSRVVQLIRQHDLERYFLYLSPSVQYRLPQLPVCEFKMDSGGNELKYGISLIEISSEHDLLMQPFPKG